MIFRVMIATWLMAGCVSGQQFYSTDVMGVPSDVIRTHTAMLVNTRLSRRNEPVFEVNGDFYTETGFNATIRPSLRFYSKAEVEQQRRRNPAGTHTGITQRVYVGSGTYMNVPVYPPGTRFLRPVTSVPVGIDESWMYSTRSPPEGYYCTTKSG